MSSEEDVKKLIELLTRQNEFLSSAGEHAQDATEIKKEWFRHVLKVLEQANVELDEVKKDIHRVSEATLKTETIIKDAYRSELELARTKIVNDIEKIEKRLDKEIDDLYDKIGKISNTDLRKELLDIIDKQKIDYRDDKKELEQYKKDLREKELDPIKRQVITLSVKTALITSGVGVILLFVIRFFLSALTGTSGGLPGAP